MKLDKKVLIIIIVIVAILIVVGVLLLKSVFTYPKVEENYYDAIEVGGQMEGRLGEPGKSEVVFMEYDSENEEAKKYRIWYPKDLNDDFREYPAVVMVNGKKMASSNYEPVFRHLASHGFIVIGNESENTNLDGTVTSDTFQCLLNLNADESNILYHRVDTTNIGIAAYREGIVEAINAMSKKNGYIYKSFFAVSPIENKDNVYDASKITTSSFAVSGTKEKNSLETLKNIYNSIPEEMTKMYARRKNANKDDMLYMADSYMTAWFKYILKDDKDAKTVFIGEKAEIRENTANWQDIEMKNI